MANSFTNGRIYANTTGSITTAPVKITYVLFIPNAGNDQAVIAESSGGTPAIICSSSSAKEPKLYDFSAKPISLSAVYIDSISSNAQVILYTTSAGRTA